MAIQDASALLRLRDGLKRHFGPEAAMFVDPFLWLLGSVCVDVVRMDNWLMQRNSDYREDESMRLFIRRKYGRKAERFVEYWLKGEGRETGNWRLESRKEKETMDAAGVETKRQP
jgi:hypothetical protein